MPNILYTVLMSLVACLLPFKLLWRGRKQAAYCQHWGERYGFYKQTPTAPVLWIHCVSVGETRAAQPLILALLDQYPQHALLITHGTPTGRETSAQLFAAQIAAGRVWRAYLPVDTPWACKRFFKHFRPVLGLLMETELWFNLIQAAQTYHTPIALISARLSEKSARGYVKLGSLARDSLQQLTWVAAQTAADAERLQALGARQVSVCGNLKFDVSPPVASQGLGAALRQLLGQQRMILMAASTREGEEALIMDAVQGLKLLTLLVPRHPQRFAEVEAMLKARGIRYQPRSTLVQPLTEDIQVVLGDTMGEMYTYYAASDFAIIGGSLQPLGGQNLIEAASMGVPTVLGPSMFNFTQVAQAAVAANAAVQLRAVTELRQVVEMLADNIEKRSAMALAAKQFTLAHGGTTQRLMHTLATLIRRQ